MKLKNVNGFFDLFETNCMKTIRNDNKQQKTLAIENLLYYNEAMQFILGGEHIIMKSELGICLIGAGRAGMVHAHNYHNNIAGARMVAIVDTVEEVARNAAALVGAPKYYTDYRAALLDDAVDAIVVVAPTDLHVQIVIDGAKAGKHVFCEKPMAMNQEECRSMIEACEENEVKLQIGFMRRFDKEFLAAKELLESGAIGELVQVHSCTRGPSKPRPWMYDLKKSNGILAEVNSHDLDAVRWMTNSDFEHLYAVGANYRNREIAGEYPDYYDSVLVNGTMKNGIQFLIDGATYVQYGYDSRMELIGTKGVIHVGRNRQNQVTCAVDGIISTPFIKSWTQLFADAYLQEDTAFVAAIREDTAPQVTGYDGMMAVAAVEAGNRSISQRSIEIL